MGEGEARHFAWLAVVRGYPVSDLQSPVSSLYLLLGQTMNIDLTGRIAIITGASRRIGIGAAVARTLAAAGADLLLTYFLPYDQSMPWGSQPGEVETLLAEIRGLGVRAYGVEANLAQPQIPAHILDAAEGLLGTPSILINNATHSENGDIERLDAEQLDLHYAVNLRGMALLCKEFVRRWPGGPGGRIINLSSGQGVTPMPGELAYIATKGAVEAFTTSLAAGVAPRGITVNAVDPGITDTGWIPDELHTTWTAAAPFGRVGLPGDIANLICFLASDQGGWITGQVIHSRGGL
jgi:3-oxoacyl-[acyl-carrier protein] reductase